MLSFKIIGLLVLEKRFYHIWAWRPSRTWPIYINFDSPFPNMLHIKFGFDVALIDQVVSEKIFENGGRRMDAGSMGIL